MVRSGINSRTIQKQRKERSKKVTFVIKTLPEVEELESSNSLNKYPISFLYNATSEFVFGFFESCILSASFAAEYGLLIRLNAIMKDEEKKEIEKKRTGLGFSEAIKRSNGVIINKELTSELRTLNNLRNMTAHPSNWITLVNDLDNWFDDDKAVERWITKVTNQSPKSIYQYVGKDLNENNTIQSVETMKAFKDERLKNLPNLDWATHKKTLTEQVIFARKQCEKLVKNMLLKKDILKLTSQGELSTKYILKKYRFPEDMALISIHTAHRTLKHLNMLTL